MGLDQSERDQQWKNLLWTNQHGRLLKMLRALLHGKFAQTQFPKAQCSLSLDISAALFSLNSVCHMYKNVSAYLGQPLCTVNSCFRAHLPLRYTTTHKQEVVKDFIVCECFNLAGTQETRQQCSNVQRLFQWQLSMFQAW